MTPTPNTPSPYFTDATVTSIYTGKANPGNPEYYALPDTAKKVLARIASEPSVADCGPFAIVDRAINDDWTTTNRPQLWISFGPGGSCFGNAGVYYHDLFELDASWAKYVWEGILYQANYAKAAAANS